MRARHVQVRGCLPTIAALVVVGLAIAAFTTVGVVLLAVALGGALLAAVARGLTGLRAPTPERRTSAAHRAADVTIDAEWVEPTEGGHGRPPKRLE